MQGAEMLLENPANSIAEIEALCGFDSPSNFSKNFKRFYKYTPREFRNQRQNNDCWVNKQNAFSPDL